MSGLEAGFRYPDIVRAGIQLVLDPPADVPIRVDPDGERKWEERRRHNREWAEEKRASGIPDIKPDLIRPLPPIKTIHLQWYDTSYEPVWRDTHVHIDLEKRRFHQIEGWLIGRQRHGSGAIGVVLFSAPVLAVISPYLYVRSKLYRSKERKQGMSRHGIVLLEKLKGQLDAETEALLVRVLKNEWDLERKLSRRVRYHEALEILQHCDLTVRIMAERHVETPTLMGDFQWRDDEGDLLGHIQFIGDHVHFSHVLGSQFEEEQVRALITWYRSCRIVYDLEE